MQTLSAALEKGIVVEITNEFKTDPSLKYEFTSKMNRVLIEHSDGTYASYTGFKKDLIFVKLGQTVYPQTPLGTLDQFNNSSYRLYFNIHYLVTKNMDSKTEGFLKNKQKS